MSSYNKPLKVDVGKSKQIQTMSIYSPENNMLAKNSIQNEHPYINVAFTLLFDTSNLYPTLITGRHCSGLRKLKFEKVIDSLPIFRISQGCNFKYNNHTNSLRTE